MKVVAKMVCRVAETYEYAGGTNVQLGAVYSADANDPNREFSQATPSATLSMQIGEGKAAVEAFQAGRAYFVVIIPVDEATAADVPPQYLPAAAGG